MGSVQKLLVLCTFVSVIKLYESAATVSFTIDPVRPVLTSPLTFTCEANFSPNKLKKLSVMSGSSEILSYQPDKRPRIQWESDKLKARFDFKKTLGKKNIVLNMSLKKPKCHDQNMYKCIYYEDGESPIEEAVRINFYVDKGKVEMINHRQSECAHLNITCIGQAGNPPEQMKWMKKSKGDSKYNPIEPSYISSERMAYHQNNCSNTRKEHFIYTPSVSETDLIVKCGFGDQMEHMSFHTPVVAPESFGITVKPEGQHEVGEEIQLTCAGLGVTDMIKFKWYKKTKDSSDMEEIYPLNPEQQIDNADDQCHTVASEMIAYIPQINDEMIYCEVEDNGHMAKAEYAIHLGVISNPTDGITMKDKDDEEEREESEEEEKEDDDHEMHHEDMTTSEPMPEEESESEPEGGDKAEPEPKSEMETTTMDKSLSEPAHQESGQLRSCLGNLYLISSLLFIAIQFVLTKSS